MTVITGSFFLKIANPASVSSTTPMIEKMMILRAFFEEAMRCRSQNFKVKDYLLCRVPRLAASQPTEMNTPLITSQ